MDARNGQEKEGRDQEDQSCDAERRPWGMREPLDDIGYGQEQNDRDHERAGFHLFTPSSPTRTMVAHSRFPARTQEETKGRGTEKVPRAILFCTASTGLRKTGKIIITGT